MKHQSVPVELSLHPDGVAFAESAHAPGFKLGPRRDPYAKLLLVASGCIQFRDWRGTEDLPAGSFRAVGAGTEHSIQDSRQATLFILGMSENFLESIPGLAETWARLLGRAAFTHLSQTTLGELAQLVRGALRPAELRGDSDRLSIATAAGRIVLRLSRLPIGAEQSPAENRVRSLLEDLAAYPWEEWTLDRAATEVELSRRRFSDLVREISGRSFVQELTDRRLEYARDLLQRGGNTITGAAFSSGFNDISHFYRLYRRRYGGPPGRDLAAVRRSHRDEVVREEAVSPKGREGSAT